MLFMIVMLGMMTAFWLIILCVRCAKLISRFFDKRKQRTITQEAFEEADDIAPPDTREIRKRIEQLPTLLAEHWTDRLNEATGRIERAGTRCDDQDTEFLNEMNRLRRRLGERSTTEISGKDLQRLDLPLKKWISATWTYTNAAKTYTTETERIQRFHTAVDSDTDRFRRDIVIARWNECMSQLADIGQRLNEVRYFVDTDRAQCAFAEMIEDLLSSRWMLNKPRERFYLTGAQTVNDLVIKIATLDEESRRFVTFVNDYRPFQEQVWQHVVRLGTDDPHSDKLASLRAAWHSLNFVRFPATPEEAHLTLKHIKYSIADILEEVNPAQELVAA